MPATSGSTLPIVPIGEWPRARRTDPETSKAAAARQGSSARSAILEAFRVHGPMTDDELVAQLAPQGHYGPTLRTARSALKAAGLVVDTGRTKPSPRGHQQVVWRLSDGA